MIEGEIIEQITKINVAHIADRHEAGKTDMALMRPSQQSRGDGT